jgi:hypothetical protein
MAELGYEDRGAFKGAFFRDVLYGDNRAWYSIISPIRHAFRKRFENVWRFILKHKPKHENGFKELSRKMQRAESTLMIGGVCGRLAREHPDVPVLTIHDSIMTHKRHLPLVERLIREEFAKLGVQPQLKEVRSERLELAQAA